MRIYKLLADSDQFDPLTLYSDDDFTLDDDFDGSSRIATWSTLHMRYFSEVEPPKLPKGDYPGFIGIPIFSLKVVEVLQDLLDGRGELLPVDVHGEPFCMFNVTKLLDCLDYESSEIEFFDDAGVTRIVGVDKFSFHEERIEDTAIFKIPEFPKGKIFVTQTFVDRVHEADLKGFSFLKVYDTGD